MDIIKKVEILHNFRVELTEAYIEKGEDLLPVPKWKDLSEKSKEAAIHSFKMIQNEAFNFNMARVHNTWVDAMIANGWVHGTTYNEERKTHPYLVDYSTLNRSLKTIDSTYKSACISLV